MSLVLSHFVSVVSLNAARRLLTQQLNPQWRFVSSFVSSAAAVEQLAISKDDAICFQQAEDDEELQVESGSEIGTSALR